MKRIVIAIPMSHGWFWPQTCISCLHRYPPVADGCECRIVVVDNSCDFSPAARGITDTRLGEGVEVIHNPKQNKFHASALDHIVQTMDFDYLMALESDVCVLRHGWLQWFMDQMQPNFFAVGHFHHEGFINPSCTLYRGDVLRDMNAWCQANRSLVLRWGDHFQHAIIEPTRDAPGYHTEDEILSWLAGPFAERRGWPEGTVLREPSRYQSADPGHYEPGQALYHWARHDGDLGYLACPTQTAWRQPSWPYQTVYGAHPTLDQELELNALTDSHWYACHFWLGTWALNILKHNVTEQHAEFMRYGLPREGRFWRQAVPEDVQSHTIALIKKHGWYTGSRRVASGWYANPGKALFDDCEAVRTIESIYRDKAGIPL